MSATTLFVISRSHPDLEGIIRDILCEETDSGNDATIDRQGTGENAEWYVQFDTRYTVDGDENAAERLSKELHCEVDVTVEWDSRDADEQGREAYVYVRGVRVREERTIMAPAGTEVVAVPVETLREWQRDLALLLWSSNPTRLGIEALLP